MSGEFLMFLIFSFVAVSGAVLLINLDKVMHMMLALVFTFLSIAGIYVLLSAEFVAMAQVMVYSGAISIMMIFGIMLTKQDDRSQRKAPLFRRLFVLIGLLGFAFVMYMGIINLDIPVQSNTLHENNTEKIGLALYQDYVIPFEIASILLLVALVGAIVIARRDDAPKNKEEDES